MSGKARCVTIRQMIHAHLFLSLLVRFLSLKEACVANLGTLLVLGPLKSDGLCCAGGIESKGKGIDSSVCPKKLSIPNLSLSLTLEPVKSNCGGVVWYAVGGS